MRDCRSAPTIAGISTVTSICLSSKWSHYTLSACESQSQTLFLQTNIIKAQVWHHNDYNFSKCPNATQYTSLNVYVLSMPQLKWYVSFSAITSMKQTLPVGGDSDPKLQIKTGEEKQWSLHSLFSLSPSHRSSSFWQFKFSDILWFLVDLALPWCEESSPLIWAKIDVFDEFYLSHCEVAVR